VSREFLTSALLANIIARAGTESSPKSSKSWRSMRVSTANFLPGSTTMYLCRSQDGGNGDASSGGASSGDAGHKTEAAVMQAVVMQVTRWWQWWCKQW